MSSLKTRRYRRNVSKKRNNKKSNMSKRRKIRSKRSLGGAPANNNNNRNNNRNNMSVGEKIEINEEVRDMGTGVSKNYNWEKFIPSGSTYCKGKDNATDNLFGGPEGRCVPGVIRSQDDTCGQHVNEWSCLKDSCSAPDIKGNVSCCAWRKSAHFSQDEDVDGKPSPPWTEVHDYIWHDPNLVDSYQDGNTSDDDSEDNDVSTERALRGVFQRDGYRMDRFVDDGGKIENEKSDRTFWKKCNNIGRYDWDKDPNGHKCWTSKELDIKLTDKLQDRFYDHHSYSSKNKKKKGKNSKKNSPSTNKRFNVVDVGGD